MPPARDVVIAVDVIDGNPPASPTKINGELPIAEHREFVTISVDDSFKGKFGEALEHYQWDEWKAAASRAIIHIRDGGSMDGGVITVCGTAFLPLFAYISRELIHFGLGAVKLRCLSFAWSPQFSFAPQLCDISPSEMPWEVIDVVTPLDEGEATDDTAVFVSLNPAFTFAEPEKKHILGIKYASRRAVHPSDGSEPSTVEIPLEVRSTHLGRIREDLTSVMSTAGLFPGKIFVQLAVNPPVALVFGQVITPVLVGSGSRVAMGIRCGEDVRYFSLRPWVQ